MAKQRTLDQILEEVGDRQQTLYFKLRIKFEKKRDPVGRGSSRNRIAGHKWERDCKDLLKGLGFIHVVTTRSESRSRDAEGVDLMNTQEYMNGRLPYNIQCKNYADHIKYHDILGNMKKVPGIINVIWHKITTNKGKDNKQGQFIPLGYYAILDVDDFMALMKMRKELEDIKNQTKKHDGPY